MAKLVEAEDEKHLNDLTTKPELFAITDANPGTVPIDAENSEETLHSVAKSLNYK